MGIWKERLHDPRHPIRGLGIGPAHLANPQRQEHEVNTTTRTFYRSSVQAFPVDHAAAIQIHRKQKEPLAWRLVNAFASLILVCLLGAIALGY